MHLDVPHPSHSLYILGRMAFKLRPTGLASPLCVPKTPLSSLKHSKHLETLEIFALPLYRCGPDHAPFRHRFPAPVPPRTDQIRTADQPGDRETQRISERRRRRASSPTLSPLGSGSASCG